MPDPDPHIMEHVHDDSNELVFHIGSDPDNPEDLGAEIEIYLDGKPMMIRKTSALYAPMGINHGPLKWKSYSRPHIEMAVIVITSYSIHYTKLYDYILGSLLYILNLVDATVDAHLFNYDISDDLSLRFIQTPQEQQVLTRNNFV